MAKQQEQVTGDRMPCALGWFSVGLGLAELAATGAVRSLTGLPHRDRYRSLLRAAGVRDLASGLGILSRRRRALWLWGRVAGDFFDLGMLTSAWRARPSHRRRLMATTVAVAGVTALDLAAATEVTRRGRASGPIEVAHAITLNRPREEVERRWAEFDGIPQLSGHLLSEVKMTPAPYRRGTEIRVRLRYDPRGGAIRSAAAWLTGADPGRKLASALRRFKQVVETGEVVRSDATIHRGMHPARPSARRVRRHIEDQRTSALRPGALEGGAR
jgi:hypothetical protein